MKRLTFFDGNEQKYGVRQKDFVLHITCDGLCYGNVIDKLGQREDIEEKLGIDLLTLIKALKNGIKYESPFHAWQDKYRYVPFVVLDFNKKALVEYDKDYRAANIFWLKDYNKTWFLRKEELE